MDDSELIDLFVASFSRLDCALPMQPSQPIRMTTNPSVLNDLYTRLPAHFPALYERLVLSYRWPEVDLELVILLENPPELSFQSLLRGIMNDPIFVKVLFPLKLIPFARGFGGSYDPVCFDCSTMTSEGDCRIVRLDHETILCDKRIGEPIETWPSFRQFVNKVIDLPTP